MAHFAKLDENNIVLEVNVVSNDIFEFDVINNSYPSQEEQEIVGIAFLTEWSGGYTNWKQTSYNGNFRKNYAGVGYSYSEELDAFIPPQPHPSWILDTETATWNAPIEYPTDGNLYIWNEDLYSWESVL